MSRPRYRLAFLPLAAWFLSVSLHCAAAVPAAPKEVWYGLFMNGRKIGYTSMREEPVAFRGAPATKQTSATVVNLAMLGAKVRQETTSVTYVDSTYHPVHQEYQIASSGSNLSLQADYEKDRIVCTVDSGGGPSQKVVTIPKDADLAGDISTATQGKQLAIGSKAVSYYLNPLTIALDKTEIEVLRKSRVKLGVQDYDAYQVAAASPMGKLVTWQTQDGEALICQMPLGMAMYRLQREQALADSASAPAFLVAGEAAAPKVAYTPPSDFAVATSIKADQPIQHPRNVRSLSLVISGLDDPALALSDERQQAARVTAKPGAYNVTVRAADFDPSGAAALPIAGAAMKPYLARAPYLETDAPEIAQLAAKLRGKETNSFKVAQAICVWVHANMTPDAGIGVPRSCRDVLSRRRGVCRDYATLYAGLARAAGVPTRVVGGIVYADGRFYYHAWAESWVGRWVAFDPTIAGPFVDATHIKFAQGDVTDMYNVGNVVGRIKVSVVSVQ